MKSPIYELESADGDYALWISRAHGQNFATYKFFIRAVKDGKASLIVHPDYVVMDKATYDKLQEGLTP